MVVLSLSLMDTGDDAAPPFDDAVIPQTAVGVLASV